MPRPGLCHAALALVAASLSVALEPAWASTGSIFQIARPTADHAALEVVEDGLRRLEAFAQPVSIIAVVGGFHTGKSFLCNVLNGTTSGFELGPTHEATTMGLWLGDTNLVSPVDGSRILLLDTEGFSAAGVAEAYDAQVFSIALLLSSHLVYNSVKLITAAEVEYLEILARRAHLWSLQADLRVIDSGGGGGDGDGVKSDASDVAALPSAGRAVLSAAASFPPLTWVVEDFFQDLGDTTPTEWLMSFIDEGAAGIAGAVGVAQGVTAEASSAAAAAGLGGGGASGTDRPRPKQGSAGPGRRPLVDGNYTISRLFGGGCGDAKAKRGAKGAHCGGSRIKAHTLFLPASTRLALRSLNTVPFADLDPEFLTQVSTLRHDLLATTSVKTAGAGAGVAKGSPGRGSLPPQALTGRGLAALLRVLVGSVGAGHFPSLPSLWSSWEGQLLSQARIAAVERHAAAGEEALQGSCGAGNTSPAASHHPPLPPDVFLGRLLAARAEAEDLFRDSLFGLEQLWAGPLVDLRRELAAREAKDTELNTAAVDRELNDAAEEAAVEAERLIESIPLPLPSGELARSTGAHAAAAADALSRRIARYAASAAPRHARAVRRLKTACAAAVASAKLASAEEEASILSAAVGASYRDYDLEMTAATIRRAAASTSSADAGSLGNVLPMSAKEIKSLDAAARMAALAAFDASIVGQEYGDADVDAPLLHRRAGSEVLDSGGGRGDGAGEDGVDSASGETQPRRRSATAWLLKTSTAAMHRSHAEKGLDKRGADWIRRNEAAAAERCAVAREGAVAEVERETDRLQYPDLEASLRAKLQDIIHRHTTGFNAQTVAIADTSAYAVALVELTRALTDHASLTVEQNAVRWHKALAPVSTAALARLRLGFTCADAVRGVWSMSTASSATAATAAAGSDNVTSLIAWRNAAWICLRDSVPLVCEHHAASVWVTEFEARRWGKGATAAKKRGDLIHNMTEATVREVARVFVATDLASHMEGVRTRFHVIFAVAIAVLAGGAWMWWWSTARGAEAGGRRKSRARSGDDVPPPPPVTPPPPPLTRADKVAAATGKPAPWIKIEHADAEEASAGAGVGRGGPSVPAPSGRPAPFAVKQKTQSYRPSASGGGSDQNPLHLAAQQPLPSVSFQAVDADRYGSGSDADSPPSARAHISSGNPLSPSYPAATNLPGLPLQMTVEDMRLEVVRVRAGDAAAEERMCKFHRHPDVRHLVSAAETFAMNTGRQGGAHSLGFGDG